MIIVTTYTSAALAEKIMGASDKRATRELRKFLRDITPKADQPGKGGRWSLEYNAKELNALKKRFATWTAEQEQAKAERAAALAAKAKVAAETVEMEPPADEMELAPETDAKDSDGDETPNIDAMLQELDEELIED